MGTNVPYIGTNIGSIKPGLSSNFTKALPLFMVLTTIVVWIAQAELMALRIPMPPPIWIA